MFFITFVKFFLLKCNVQQIQMCLLVSLVLEIHKLLLPKCCHYKMLCIFQLCHLMHFQQMNIHEFHDNIAKNIQTKTIFCLFV